MIVWRKLIDKLPLIQLAKCGEVFIGGVLLFTDDATSSESLITENIFSGETVFLYFDSNIPESRQHDIRKQLRFQGASVGQFFDKKVSVLLALWCFYDGQASPGKELEQGNKNKRKVKVYSKS